MAVTDLSPPPKKEDPKFDNWLFRLWQRARNSLDYSVVGATSPIITTAGTGTVNISHGTSGVIPGTYGSVSAIPIVVVDTYGHVTSGTTTALTGTAITGSDLTINAPLLGTVTNALLRAGAISHATSGVVTGTYGSSSIVPVVGVNTYGHIISVTTQGISLSGTAYTGTGTVSVTSPIIISAGTGDAATLKSFTLAHATSGALPGTYGGTFGIPRVVVDTYGHITAGTSFPLQATTPILAGSNAGTFTFGHTTSGAIPGTYGGTAGYGRFVIDTYGHVTAGTQVSPIVPRNIQNGNYTLAAVDIAGFVYREGTATGLATYTVPSTLGTGALVTLVNDGTGIVTITASGTLVFAGTGATGNRSLPQYGMASVLSLTSDRWMISGAGVS